MFLQMYSFLCNLIGFMRRCWFLCRWHLWLPDVQLYIVLPFVCACAAFGSAQLSPLNKVFSLLGQVKFVFSPCVDNVNGDMSNLNPTAI